MSWSVSAIGTPEKVASYLDGYMAGQSGQSKDEYDAAKPHLIALVRQNYATSEAAEWYRDRLVSIDAGGSGQTLSGKDIQRNCTVTLRDIGKLLI